MQSRRLVLFLVCLVAWVLLATWGYNTFFPQPTPPEPTKTPSKADVEQAQKTARAVAGPVALFKQTKDDKDAAARTTTVAAAGGTAVFEARQRADRRKGLALAGAVAVFEPPPPPPPIVPRSPKPDVVEITLGSDNAYSEYHLGATLTAQGAGVRSLTLNKFQQADARGKPEWQSDAEGNPVLIDGKKVPKPMELIQGGAGNLNGKPSFLLYHYARLRSGRGDKSGEPVPVETLAERVWTLTRVRGNAAFCDAVAAELRDNAGKTEFERVDGAQQLVEFSTDLELADLDPDSTSHEKCVRVTKTFTTDKGEYHLGLAVKARLLPGAHFDKPFRYQLAGAHAVRVEGVWYNSVQRQALIGILEDNSLTRTQQDLKTISIKEGGDLVEPHEGQRLIYAAVGVQFFASALVVDDQQENKDFLSHARPTLEARLIPYELTKPVKLGDETLRITDPSHPDDANHTEDVDLTQRARDLLEGRPVGTPVGLLVRPGRGKNWEVFDVKFDKDIQPLFYNDITVRVVSKKLDLKEEPTEHKYLLYNGPVKVRLLGQMDGAGKVDDKLVTRYHDELHLDTLTDYHSPSWIGKVAGTLGLTWVIIKVTNVMHTVLGFLHNYIPVYGICIILLTIMVRGMMFPVSRKQAMTSIRMQSLAPELKKLQEKYKDDRQAYGVAQMELFRKNGVNPFGSCWMVFLQMPIFMGLYYALQESVFFRLSPFLWMENLAAPDMLFEWGNNIPVISTPASFSGGFMSFLYLGPYLNLLPMIAVTLMIFQQKMTMPPPTDEQQAMQQKMMKWMMIIFCIMFYKVAGGLCIYFIASSIWGFCERKLLPKKKTVPADGSAPPPPAAPAGNGLLQRWLAPAGDVPAAAALDTAANVDGGKGGLTKAQRKQERERRKQVRDVREGVTTRPQAGEDLGWWGNLKQRVRKFWDEVQRQAEKKRQAERNK